MPSRQPMSVFKCLNVQFERVCVCECVLMISCESSCLPWRGPVVSGAVQEGADIGLVSPGHVNYQHAWEQREGEKE